MCECGDATLALMVTYRVLKLADMQVGYIEIYNVSLAVSCFCGETLMI